MKPLPLDSGVNYSYDGQGRKICTGSRMGRRNELPFARGTIAIKLSLVRLRLVDGCYDKAGAYWGGPDTMYYASARYHDDTLDDWFECRIFVRATTRRKAKAAVRKLVPNARFYR